MRFLLNKRSVLELTFQLIVAAIHLGTHGAGERTKMDALVETFAARFFKF